MSNGNGSRNDKSAIRLVAETVHGDIGGRVLAELVKLRRQGANYFGGNALLCKLLRDLGFDDVVDEFEQLTKWHT